MVKHLTVKHLTVYAIDVFLLPHGRKMIGDVAGERGRTGSNSKSYRISAVASKAVTSKRNLACARGVPSSIVGPNVSKDT